MASRLFASNWPLCCTLLVVEQNFAFARQLGDHVAVMDDGKVAHRGGMAAFIDVEHALDPVYARKLGVDVDNLLVSQPDYGEQALEITAALIASGALTCVNLANGTERNHEPTERVSQAALEGMLGVTYALLGELAAEG